MIQITNGMTQIVKLLTNLGWSSQLSWFRWTYLVPCSSNKIFHNHLTLVVGYKTHGWIQDSEKGSYLFPLACLRTENFSPIMPIFETMPILHFTQIPLLMQGRLLKGACVLRKYAVVIAQVNGKKVLCNIGKVQ